MDTQLGFKPVRTGFPIRVRSITDLCPNCFKPVRTGFPIRVDFTNNKLTVRFKPVRTGFPIRATVNLLSSIRFKPVRTGFPIRVNIEYSVEEMFQACSNRIPYSGKKQ